MTEREVLESILSHIEMNLIDLESSQYIKDDIIEVLKIKESKMLINTISTGDQLKQEFADYNRDQYLNGTYDALITYYEEFEEGIELDVVAICCDLSEETYEEAAENYSIEIDYDGCDDEDDRKEALKEQVVEHLNYNTSTLFEGDDVVSYWSF